MNQQLDTFETSLLTALRHEVSSRSRAPARPPRSRRRVLLVAAGTVAAATAGLVVLPTLGTSPAYSVQEGNAGEITVKVNRLEDGSGLEAALREKGIRAEVLFLPDGGQCTRSGIEVVDRRGISMSIGAERFDVTLAPGAVRPGETLVIDASIVALPAEPTPDSRGVWTMEGVRAWVSAEVVEGDTGRCLPG